MKSPVRILIATIILLALLALAPSVLAQEGEGNRAPEVSNVSVEPAKVAVGQTVSIKAEIKNTNDVPGTFTVILKINDKDTDSLEINLAPGETKTIRLKKLPLRHSI